MALTRGTGRRLVAVVAGVVAAAGLLSSCGATTSSTTEIGAKAAGRSVPTSGTTTSSAPTTTTTTTVPAQPGWTVLAREPTGVAVDEQTFLASDGSKVTLIRFRAGQVHYDLHAGATDPPRNGATVGPNGQDAISAAETPILLAAFNGGFKVTTGAGGMEVNGQTLTPLVPGMASLVVTANGTATIGVWGQSFPPPADQVVGVRQNLPPLVLAGQPSGQVGDVAAWGATIGGSYVARSALGQTATGSLIYAGSMSTVPADLAQALVGAGATIAMELDINPEWVQADVAPAPGAPLVASVPGQNRPATQYVVGWTRDFVAVLAGGPSPPATSGTGAGTGAGTGSATGAGTGASSGSATSTAGG